jgi:hypothetical protein
MQQCPAVSGNTEIPFWGADGIFPIYPRELPAAEDSPVYGDKFC